MSEGPLVRGSSCRIGIGLGLGLGFELGLGLGLELELGLGFGLASNFGICSYYISDKWTLGQLTMNHNENTQASTLAMNNYCA